MASLLYFLLWLYNLNKIKSTLLNNVPYTSCNEIFENSHSTLRKRIEGNIVSKNIADKYLFLMAVGIDAAIFFVLIVMQIK